MTIEGLIYTGTKVHDESRFGGNQGIVPSSISSSFGAAEACEISCNPLGTRGVGLTVPSPVDLPRLMVAMVSRDHGTSAWAVAFFKEIMRRDAMTGMRSMFVLRQKSMSV